MRSHLAWFFVLAALSVAAPYLLRVPPKSTREWRLIALTIAFLAWLLALMAPLRSR